MSAFPPSIRAAPPAWQHNCSQRAPRDSHTKTTGADTIRFGCRLGRFSWACSRIFHCILLRDHIFFKLVVMDGYTLPRDAEELLRCATNKFGAYPVRCQAAALRYLVSRGATYGLTLPDIKAMLVVVHVDWLERIQFGPEEHADAERMLELFAKSNDWKPFKQFGVKILEIHDLHFLRVLSLKPGKATAEMEKDGCV